MSEEFPEPTVIKDNRRIDPQTGEVRGEASPQAPAQPTVGGPDDGAESYGADGSAGGDLEAAQALAAQRLEELQRLNAEYVNYRKRVDRDRQLIAEQASYKALTPVVEVLDTIDRAREHGELDGGLKAVADQLERVVAAAGLVRFGEPGDAFDPMLHEALSHLGADADVEVTTVKHVAKGGYRLGDRVVRAAQVLVVDPADA